MVLLRQLNAKERITVVLVTHEADIAAYAKRQIHFRDGQVISDERKEE
jgi:putative ABC transport system ATP-binding protein